VGAKLTTRRLAAAVTITVFALLVTACTGGSHTQPVSPAASGGSQAGSGGGAGGASAPAAASTDPNAPVVSISPADGAKNADPAAGVTVTAAKGTLSSVKVSPAGGALANSGNTSGPVSGTMNSGSTSWHTQWALGISQKYAVTVTATRNGETKTTTSTFTTLSPSSTFSTHIFEGDGQAYGVGMPLILTFSQPIKNKADVERAVELKTSKPVIGAWYWDGSQTLAFRPRDYWPENTSVSFIGHFNGVEGASGVYGFHTLTQSFRIGRSVIAVASTKTHHTQIFISGKLKYDWPISTGRPGDETPNGSYLTIEKANPVEMKGPGYDLMVPFSVRLTWSGVYYHDAPWSTGVQGTVNVSHGCVNLSPARAETYYNLAVPGDPITIKDSPKAGVWGNGWTYWFLTWRQLLAGSATHQAVQAGPTGSTFVDASALPASTAKAPIGTAASGIWGTGPK
jgi:lipoprotein-anchoring transpeptidase ErfK/SrfK